MRIVVKLFLFLLFVLAAFGVEYYLTQINAPERQVQAALDQMKPDHKVATDARVAMWFWSLDSVHLAVATFVFFIGVVVFWDELAALVKWPFLPKPKESETNG